MWFHLVNRNAKFQVGISLMSWEGINYPMDVRVHCDSQIDNISADNDMANRNLFLQGLKLINHFVGDISHT